MSASDQIRNARQRTTTQGQGFDSSRQSTSQKETLPGSAVPSALKMKPENIDSANAAKAIAQQTVDGIQQYIGHTQIDVLNGVRSAKHHTTDLVSDAIAEELHPARIRAELMTATVGKLQGLEPSSAKGFVWGLPLGCSSADLALSPLAVMDMSHIFPASTQKNDKQLQSSSQKNEK